MANKILYYNIIYITYYILYTYYIITYYIHIIYYILCNYILMYVDPLEFKRFNYKLRTICTLHLLLILKH